MIQYQKQTYVQSLNHLWRHNKNDVIFQKYDSDVSMMTHQLKTITFLKNFGEDQRAYNIFFPWLCFRS